MNGTLITLTTLAALAVSSVWADKVKDIKADIAADPNNADLYAELGMEYETVSDWKNAAMAYVMAVGLAPGDANLHFRLAEVYLNDDLLPQAVEEYRAAARYDASLKKPYYQMGRAYLGMKDFANAAQSFNSYLEGFPYDFNALWYLGQAYEGQRDYAAALTQYRKILDYCTGPFARAGEIGVFGTADDLEEYINKTEKKAP